MNLEEWPKRVLNEMRRMFLYIGDMTFGRKVPRLQNTSELFFSYECIMVDSGLTVFTK